MVEYNITLDQVFHSLSDVTRRDILRRVSRKELSIGTLAKPYNLSFAAIAKHVGILERAGLVRKRRRGKEQRVIIVPKTVERAQNHLEKYEKLWEERFEKLDEILKSKE